MGRLSSSVVGLALLLVASPLCAADAPAPVARTYALPCSPSELLRRHDALLALAARVRADLTAAEVAEPAADAATMRRRHTTLFQIAVLERDTLAAHRAIARVRATLDAAAQRAVSGLFTEPYVEARVSPGADLHAAYRERLARRLAALPYDDVDFTLQAVRGQLANASPDTALGTARAVLDPLAADGRLPADAAASLIALAVSDELANTVRADIVACVDALVAAHRGDATVFEAKVGVLEPPARGAWFGQAPPGRTPVRFAPAILDSLSVWTNGVAFSPDGRECFISVGGATYGGSQILHATCVGGVWTPFAPLPALAGFVTTMEPHVARDGRTLYLTAKRAGEFRRLYASKRTGTTWGVPTPEPAPIVGEGDAYRGRRADDGTWYFGLQADGMMQIRRATPDGAGGYRFETLGSPVNQRTFDGDPCVAPDGRWLVFNSARNAALGGADLYVSFADGHGGWGTPIPLGPAFNSPVDEFGAMLSPDGKQLFYTRHGNTGNEIRWVSTDAIDALRPTGRR